MLPRLPLAALRLHFRLDAPPSLPAYAGSAWRGAFGHALKRAVCVVPGPACGDCPLYRGCAYSYVFETPPPPDSAKMRKYEAVQHPFVLAPEPAPDEASYVLGVTLFGRGAQYLPHVVHALSKAGEGGVGKRRQPFRLERVEQAGGDDLSQWRDIFRPGRPLTPLPAAPPAPPPPPAAFGLSLLTPLRLRREEVYVAAEDFQFADCFGALLRRISMLTYFHTDTPLEADFAGLAQAARAVPLAGKRLVWRDWERYSSRQKTTMKMGGLMGEFLLDGRAAAAFWPYLWLGQWTHVGKAATMGLGRYRIVPAREEML